MLTLAQLVIIIVLNLSCAEQIDELLLDPCCALKYYPSIEECVRVSQNIF